MGSIPRPVIVVGVDGSPQSRRAALWAAGEARLRKQSLQLLHAAYWPVIGYPEFGYPPDFEENSRHQAKNLLDSTAHEITTEFPDVEVATLFSRADPRTALVEASAGVSLTVTGTLGQGRLKEVLLGSVAMHVAAHGRSPVAVVPDMPLDRRGPVLLGVDGSAHSEEAVGYAFDAAALRGAKVVVVMVVDTWGRQGFAARPLPVDSPEFQSDHAAISEQVAGWADKYPDVRVEELVFRGQAADCLLGYAAQGPEGQQPQMIVVGSRGRGGLTGLLLGSTSHALIAHASCPVVVVRAQQS